MSRRLSFLLTGILFICFSLLWTGCDEKEDSDPVGVKFEKTGNIQFSLSKTTLNDEVSNVTAILTRTGYSAIRKDLFINGFSASGRIDDIHVGTWQLLVEAKDTNQVVLYRGKANVEIKGNMITYVSINLSTVSSIGDLAINVTWEQSDGITWTKYSGNPVITTGSAGSWESKYSELPCVVFDGTEYKMWYSGSDQTKTRIGLATSIDGKTWTKYSGNPVLNTGSSGEWDEMYVFDCAVIYDGTEYKMWFCGGKVAGNYEIGYATSPDGINWTKYSGNPVLTTSISGTWDSKFILSPSVIYDEGGYKMWFTGENNASERQMGYATSPDGIHWSKYSGNPVLSKTANAWDSFSVSGASVLHDGQEYKMWYNGSDGTNYRTGLATSADGISWTKYSGNPVMDIGENGTWDDVHAFHPSVIYDQDKFKMWYIGYDSNKYLIGYAASPY